MLARLELEILDLHNSLNLRPTLETVIAIGERLTEARAMVPHGQWLPWVRKLGISPRTVQRYLAVFRRTAHATHETHKKQVSLSSFLRTMRQADKAARREQQRQQEAEAIRQAPDPSCRLVHADCRKYAWPQVDVIATDPPWMDMDCYRWLNTFAKGKQLLLVQCSVSQLQRVLAIITELYSMRAELAHGQAADRFLPCGETAEGLAR